MDVSIENVLEVLDREIKHDGRISGLGKHAGKHVKVVVVNDCEDGLFTPALTGPGLKGGD